MLCSKLNSIVNKPNAVLYICGNAQIEFIFMASQATLLPAPATNCGKSMKSFLQTNFICSKGINNFTNLQNFPGQTIGGGEWGKVPERAAIKAAPN